MAEERINKFEDRSINIIQSKKQREKNEEKLAEPQRPVRLHQMYQYKCNRNLKKRRKRGQKIIEKTADEKISN